PLRLARLGDDPRSIGFPPNHPPMQTFLGVPVVLRGVAYGNLYLTEKPGGFTEEDEELVALLAGQAAVAVENARLYESATRWSRQLESLNAIGSALVGELELDRLLELVATRLRELIGARVVLIALPTAGDRLRIEAANGEEAGDLPGWSFPRSTSKAGRVLDRGRSERVDDMLDDPEVDHESARRFRARTGLYVPLVVRERSIGVVVAHDKLGAERRFGDDDQRLAEQFGQRAAVAVDLSERVASDALRRVVAGQELERRRLARELHDETGQALTSILLGLKTVEDAGDEADMRAAVARLRELVVETLQDVRRLAVELRPTALDDFGLVPAVERFAQTFGEQTGIEVQLESQLGPRRLEEDVETALYRLVQEAMTNVVKHAHAQTVSILLVRRDGVVTAVIEDDGRGFDPGAAREGGLGLVGMRERAGLVGGRLTVESSVGVGTTIAVEVPA
ncbi:MAG: sensor histidine kinase, partial [Gaiellaceae bacterium]